jgi:hypothetical protein
MEEASVWSLSTDFMVMPHTSISGHIDAGIQKVS